MNATAIQSTVIRNSTVTVDGLYNLEQLGASVPVGVLSMETNGTHTFIELMAMDAPKNSPHFSFQLAEGDTVKVKSLNAFPIFAPWKLTR